MYRGACARGTPLNDVIAHPRIDEAKPHDEREHSCCGRHKKNPAHGRVFGFLVAGARLSNYMQIKVEPFPLVA